MPSGCRKACQTFDSLPIIQACGRKHSCREFVFCPTKSWIVLSSHSKTPASLPQSSTSVNPSLPQPFKPPERLIPPPRQTLRLRVSAIPATGQSPPTPPLPSTPPWIHGGFPSTRSKPPRIASVCRFSHRTSPQTPAPNDGIAAARHLVHELQARELLEQVCQVQHPDLVGDALGNLLGVLGVLLAEQVLGLVRSQGPAGTPNLSARG